MNSSRWILSLSVAAFIGCIGLLHSEAQQPKTEAPAPQEPNPKITPVVLIQPGESKELVMSTWCRVGITRGGGLSVKMMTGGSFDDVKDSNDRQSKTWKLAGITIQVPDFAMRKREPNGRSSLLSKRKD